MTRRLAAQVELMPFQTHHKQPTSDPRIKHAEQKAEFISCLVAGNNAMVKDAFADAAVCYEKAIRANPEYYLPYAKAGNAYYKQQEYEKALSYYVKSLEMSSDQVETIYRMGKCYQELDKPVQAAIAFDLARGKDDQGVFVERITEGLQEIERTVKRAMPPVSLTRTLGASLKWLTTQPRLFKPFFIYYVITSLVMLGTNLLLLGAVNAAPPAFNLGDKVSFAYYGILIFVNLFFGVPFYASAMVTLRDLYAEKAVSGRDSLRQAYARLPALVGVTMLAVMLMGGVLLLGIVVCSLLVLPFFKPGMASLVTLAAVFIAGLFAPFFSYQYQYILIKNKNFEDAISLSFRMGGRRYIRTILLLVICGLPFIALIKFSFGHNIFQYLGVSLVRVALMGYVVVMLTVFFYKATGLEEELRKTRERKQRRRKHEEVDDQQPGESAGEDAMPPPHDPGPETLPPEQDIVESPEPVEIPVSELSAEEDPHPGPELPDDLVLEEHVELPEHLRSEIQGETGDPEDDPDSL